MSSAINQPLESLDSPQLVLDLDVIDQNVGGSLHRARPGDRCSGPLQVAQVRRAGTLYRPAGLRVPGRQAQRGRGAGRRRPHRYPGRQPDCRPIKLPRLAELARRASMRVCVDDPDNVAAAAAARAAGATLGVLVEVDIGMSRCGVEPGEPALPSPARSAPARPGLRRPAGLRWPPATAARPGRAKGRIAAASEKLIGTRR